MDKRSDREIIHDMICLYTHALDRRRWDIMPTLFHDDGIFLFGDVSGDWKGFVEQARTIIDPMISTHHQLGNILINIEGNTAWCECYLTATHIIPADFPEGLPLPAFGRDYIATIGGRYIDKFEKRDGKWGIVSRNGLYDWRQYTEINDGDLRETLPGAVGQVDDSDPSTPVTKAWRGS